MPKHKLNRSAREQWAIDGFLIMKGVLSRTQIKRFSSEVDRLHRKYVVRNPDVQNSSGLDRRNILPESPIFHELIDHPATFQTVLDLMGPHIQLSMAEAIMRPPDPDFKGYIHTDGGQALRHIRVSETSWPIQLKIQYFLTDVSRQNMGNFTRFPGSHLRPYPEGDAPINAHTPGAVQVCANAGDAAIFPHSLWHGVSPNKSRRARKTLIYGYGQLCFRTFDFDGHSEEVMKQCTPRQRRLLGDLGSDWRPGAYFYSPADQEKVMKGPRRRKRI